MRMNPFPPAMFKYTVLFDAGGALSIVTDHALDVDDPFMSKWIKAREYHPNVSKYFWNTNLKTVYICMKKVAYIEFDGYIKPPLGKQEEKE